MNGLRSGIAAAALALLFAVPAAAQQAPGAEAGPETVTLPAELDRVLRDYEAAWSGRDAAALAALFTVDGFVMARGRMPARGRARIEEHYRGSGGPLALRAFAYAMEGDVAWILGGYATLPGGPEMGKFTLTLKRAADGKWLIASDMDNANF